MATCLQLCEKWSVGGYARGGMRGPLGQIASSPSSGTSFFSDPQRRARFPGFGNESSDLVFRNLIFSVPQRRARFPGSANVSFRGPLRANGPSKPLQTHFGYARGMRGPREWRTPQSGSRQAVWKSMLVQNGYARGYAHYIYIYNFVHNSARVCARVCASYIYVFS